MELTKSRKNAIILTLGTLSALGPFTIDMYLPGFSAIARDLGTDISTVGYSLTSYFIGISLGQLVYGPVTDRFGRKKPLLLGMSIYLAASVALIFSPSVAWLVGFRFLMALGGCVGIVVSRSVVRDLFPLREIAQIFSTFILVVALSPMLAPSFGAILTEGPGWRYIFLSLALFAAFLLLMTQIILPESKAPDKSISLRPGKILRQYLEVLRNPSFLIHAIVSGLSFSALFSYISVAPKVLLEAFGLTQAQFSWAFAFNASGLIIGSQINRLLLKRWSPSRITRSSLGVQILFGLSFLILVLATGGSMGLYPVVLLLFLFLFCSGMINPNATTLALAPFSHNAGTASALLGSIQMAFGALASGLMSALAGGLLALSLVTFLAASIGAILIRAVKEEAR